MLAVGASTSSRLESTDENKLHRMNKDQLINLQPEKVDRLRDDRPQQHKAQHHLDLDDSTDDVIILLHQPLLDMQDVLIEINNLKQPTTDANLVQISAKSFVGGHVVTEEYKPDQTYTKTTYEVKGEEITFDELFKSETGKVPRHVMLSGSAASALTRSAKHVKFLQLKNVGLSEEKISILENVLNGEKIDELDLSDNGHIAGNSQAKLLNKLKIRKLDMWDWNISQESSHASQEELKRFANGLPHVVMCFVPFDLKSSWEGHSFSKKVGYGGHTEDTDHSASNSNKQENRKYNSGQNNNASSSDAGGDNHKQTLADGQLEDEENKNENEEKEFTEVTNVRAQNMDATVLGLKQVTWKFNKEKIDENYIEKLFLTLKKDDCLESLRFLSCNFTEFLLQDLLKKLELDCNQKVCNQMKITLFEISDAKNLSQTDAEALGSFLSVVDVQTLDVHGSNLKQFASVFQNALMNSKNPNTRIVFETDEVKIKIDSSGTGKQAEFGFSGCSIFVPPGALESETEISVMAVPELTKLPGNLIQVTPIVRCRPTGLKFIKPITLRLSTWCRTASESAKLTVLTREDEKSDWDEECNVKYQNENFIVFEISHFSDDVAGGSDSEMIPDYQIIVHQKKFAHYNQYQEIYTYCFPSNGDFQNYVYENAQLGNLVPLISFPPTEIKSGQKISIQIVPLEHENEIDIENDGKKDFQCSVNPRSKNIVTSLTVECRAQKEVKENGIKANFQVSIDDVPLHTKSFKILWVPYSNETNNMVLVKSMQFVNKQYNIKDSNIQHVGSVEEPTDDGGAHAHSSVLHGAEQQVEIPHDHQDAIEDPDVQS